MAHARPTLLWELSAQGGVLPQSGVEQLPNDAGSTAVPPVLPTLHCRRCALLFDTPAEFRRHYRGVHAQPPSASGGGADPEPPSSSGSSSSSEGAPDEDAVGDDAHGALLSVYLPPLRRSIFVYRGLLTSSGDPVAAAAAGEKLRAPDAPPITLPSVHALVAPGETWGVLLLTSGFFMAAVFEVCPGGARAATPHGPLPDTAWPRAVLHKRFSHYTMRKKQGGAQSAHDASRGATAKSAGASLRRAGELHLSQDVVKILSDPAWVAALGVARRLWISCPRVMLPQLYCEGQRALVKGDPRVNKMPFAVGRPSLAEAERCVCELLRVVEVDEVVRDRGKAAKQGKARQQAGGRESPPPLSAERPPPPPRSSWTHSWRRCWRSCRRSGGIGAATVTRGAPTSPPPPQKRVERGAASKRRNPSRRLPPPRVTTTMRACSPQPSHEQPWRQPPPAPQRTPRAQPTPWVAM